MCQRSRENQYHLCYENQYLMIDMRNNRIELVRSEKYYFLNLVAYNLETLVILTFIIYNFY